MARYHAQTEMEFMSLSSCCRFSFFGYISTYSDGLSFVKFMLLVARKECDEAIVHFCISKNGSPDLSFQLKNVSSALDVVVFGAIRIVCRQKLSNLCIVETGDRAPVGNNSKLCKLTTDTDKFSICFAKWLCWNIFYAAQNAMKEDDKYELQIDGGDCERKQNDLSYNFPSTLSPIQVIRLSDNSAAFASKFVFVPISGTEF